MYHKWIIVLQLDRLYNRDTIVRLYLNVTRWPEMTSAEVVLEMFQHEMSSSRTIRPLFTSSISLTKYWTFTQNVKIDRTYIEHVGLVLYLIALHTETSKACHIHIILIRVENEMGVEFCPVWSITIKVCRWYWMFWYWILNLYHKTGFFIFSWKQSTKYKKSCLINEINAIFYIENIQFSDYYIFLVINVLYVYIKYYLVDTACNTWCDVTII